jgi:hypothetical protein
MDAPCSNGSQKGNKKSEEVSLPFSVSESRPSEQHFARCLLMKPLPSTRLIKMETENSSKESKISTRIHDVKW